MTFVDYQRTDPADAAHNTDYYAVDPDIDRVDDTDQQDAFDIPAYDDTAEQEGYISAADSTLHTTGDAEAMHPDSFPGAGYPKYPREMH